MIALAFAQEAVVITDAQIEKLTQTYGQTARTRLLQWRMIMSDAKYKSLVDQQKIVLVNDFMNLTPFKTDQEHWGKADYWATPTEFLSTNGGDCEDYSIAKYFTLRALGVPDEKLQIMYVKETVVFKEAHMVLAYFATPDAEPVILDNINKVILPASKRTDLTPVYSFNGTGLWAAKQRQSSGSSSSISNWKELQTRMKGTT